MIYLDYNATTPVDPAVLEAMLPYFSEQFANAASVHISGRRAAAAVGAAREQIADGLGVRASSVIITSGATEADNLALLWLRDAAGPRRRLVVGATEHKAVLDTADHLAAHGVPVTMVRPDASGQVTGAAVEAVMDDDVVLVSVMVANNETGVINPWQDICDTAHSHGALFHTDATQALGRLALDLSASGVDLAAVSAHKVYGPKGVGALVGSRAGMRAIEPQLHGGGHERGLRSGTLNVPGIVGFGAAVALAGARVEGGLLDGVAELRDRLEAKLVDLRAGVIGANAPRLGNTTNVRFDGADAEAVMANTPGVAMSSGSACTAAVPSPSHVLLAMGLDTDAANECLRFSLGVSTTAAEVDAAASAIAAAVERVRELEARSGPGSNGLVQVVP